MSTGEGDPIGSASDWYEDRGVLVLGGLGFIGSAIARRTARAGARVDVVDSLLPGAGGDRRNLSGLRSRVRIEVTDARNVERYAEALEAADVVFVTTGGLSHQKSLEEPVSDFDATCSGLLAVLHECRKRSLTPRVVLAGTRQVYGTEPTPPASESHPVTPADVNAVWSIAAEELLFFYGRIAGIEGASLRLTNVYGPGMGLDSGQARSLVNVFFSEALEGGLLTVYGDGSLVRDFTHIDDVVSAFLLAGSSAGVAGRPWNVGSGTRTTVGDLASALATRTSVEIEYRPLPPEYEGIAVGDYWTDHTAFTEATGWRPEIGLDAGVEHTLDALVSGTRTPADRT